jgi:hypothetical protein
MHAGQTVQIACSSSSFNCRPHAQCRPRAPLARHPPVPASSAPFAAPPCPFRLTLCRVGSNSASYCSKLQDSLAADPSRPPGSVDRTAKPQLVVRPPSDPKMAPKVKRRRLDPPTKDKNDVPAPTPAAAPATETATTSTNGAHGNMATEPKFETLQLHAGYLHPCLTCPGLH